MGIHDHDHDLGQVPDEQRADGVRRDEHGHAADALRSGVPEAAGPAGVLAMQRAAGNATVAQLLEDESAEQSPVADVIGGGGGAALDEGVRAPMEAHLGADFSDVRVHTDAKASESAEAVGAQAYTVGNDIAFRSGSYAPGTMQGQRMLAHELTHVVQQRSGPVDGTAQAGGIKVSDPSDRFEQAAERSADGYVAAQTSLQRQAGEEEELQTSVQREPAEEEELQASVQREGAEEEEELQTFVQRQAGAMEEEEEEAGA